MTDRRICLGMVVAAHGIKGAVKVKTFTQHPKAIAAYGPVEDEKATRPFVLRVLSVDGDSAIVKIKGIDDRDAAEKLAKDKLAFYVARAVLPAPKKGQYYLDDLKGLAALNEAGEKIAVVTAAYNFGAGDIIELESVEEGFSFMLPLKEPFAGTIDLKAGSLRILESAMVEQKPKRKPGVRKQKPEK